MTRFIFAIALAAISLVPQSSEAQLFRGGFRARGFRDQAPRPRLRVFQTPQAKNLNRQPNSQIPQFNRQAPNAWRSHADSGQIGQSVLTGNGNSPTPREVGNQNDVIQQMNFQDQTQANGGAAEIGTLAPVAPTAKQTFSILEILGETQKGEVLPKSDKLAPILELKPVLEPLAAAQTTSSLEIIAPPLEPIEVMPINSILQIVEPKNAGK